MEINEPILITGCARSGTSMVAGIIQRCGAFGGETFLGSRWNRKGFYENKRIRVDIQKAYMKDIGMDPQGQIPLPGTKHMPMPVGFGYVVKEAIRRDGYVKGKWYYKDATMCLNWPVWNKAFPKAKWVIVRRPDDQIVNSCLRTAFMSKRTTVEEWQQWVDHHKRCFEDMRKAGLTAMEVWSDEIVDGEYDELKMVMECLGLQWNEEEIEKFVSKKLWHASQGFQSGGVVEVNKNDVMFPDTETIIPKRIKLWLYE